MKFKIKASDVNTVLGVVGIVPPSPIAANGAGFLFTIQADGKAFVYSRDNQHFIRSSVDVSDVEGSGSFVYPTNFVGAFRFLGDQGVSFEAKEEEGRFSIRYETESGASAEHATFDPKLMMTHTEEELAGADDDCQVPAGILREALGMSQPFVGGKDARLPQFKTVQLYDATKEDWKAGDGYVFAAEGVRAYYFFSEVLKGKKLAINSDHLKLLTSFLTKCTGDVQFKTGKNYTFAISQDGTAIGWSHETKTHGKFKYYQLASDHLVLKVPKESFLNALRYTRSELDKKKDTVKFCYTAKPTPTIHLEGADGTGKASSFFVHVEIEPDKRSAEDQDMTANINLNYCLNLVEEIKAHEFDLRVMLIAPKEGATKKTSTAVFRSVDTFHLTADGKTAGPTEKDAYECKVTRFMPSKE